MAAGDSVTSGDHTLFSRVLKSDEQLIYKIKLYSRIIRANLGILWQLYNAWIYPLKKRRRNRDPNRNRNFLELPVTSNGDVTVLGRAGPLLALRRVRLWIADFAELCSWVHKTPHSFSFAIIMRCKLCSKNYDSRRHVPLILPSCGHTVCRMCLLDLEEEETQFKCPRCDKLHKRPSVQDLQINRDYLDDEDDSRTVANYRPSSAASQSCVVGGSGFKVGGGINVGFGVNENGVNLGVNVTGGLAIDEFKVVGNAGLGVQAGPHGVMINGQAGLAVGLGQDAFICGGSASMGLDPLPRIGANSSYQYIPGGSRSIMF